MRKLMWFTSGLGAAMLLSAYVLSCDSLGYLAIAAAIGAIIAYACHFQNNRIITAVLLGAAIGFLYFWIFSHWILSPVKSTDGETELLSMEATDYSFDTQYGRAVDGRSTVSGISYRVRLYYSGQDIKPGDKITVRAKLSYTADSSLEISTYHKGEGIFLLAKGEGNVRIDRPEKIPAKYFPVLLHKAIKERITLIFPVKTAAFAQALLLGDDNGISFEENYAFQKSGIRHIIAVSGLHVSILFSVLFFVTGRKRMLNLLLGIPLLFLFAAVAGFTPSVNRACMMQGLFILSAVVQREYDTFSSLSFACLIMLVINPMTITSVSFQLSVGCMIGIFLFSDPLHGFFSKRIKKQMKGKSMKAKLLRWIVGSLSVSISAMSLTLPLCAVYFGFVSVVGIFTNLLTLWVISFAFCGIIIACILSAVWQPLGVFSAWVVSLPIGYVQGVSRFMARIPFGAAYTDSPYTVLWIISVFLLFGLFLVVKRKIPCLFAGSVVLLYAISVLASWAEPYMDDVRMTVLDVGQGQCILLQSKDQCYVVDCGGEDPEHTASTVISAMGANGITSLDGVILTHYDQDHINGVIPLLQCANVDRVYLPTAPDGEELYGAIKELKIPVSWVEKDANLCCGTGQLHIFGGKNDECGNDSSLCILFQGENCDILITGDRDFYGESLLLSQTAVPSLDVLVVGHHGASTSTGLALLERTTPQVAIISVGKDNTHGHPHRETLNRLESFGCYIYRTDRDGTIIIKG